MSDKERIADLEARLAMVTEALKPFAEAERAWMASGSSQRIAMDWLTAAREVVDATEPDTTAFLARVKRQGAAEGWREIAQWLRDGADHDSLLSAVSQRVWREQAKVADERAAELEGK